MQNTPPNQAFLWDKDDQTGRMAFYLAALLSVGVSLQAATWAETGSDLNISKDGGNVNVNLNTASSSDVSIRRSDDIMVIKVPKSYKGGVNIDPSLKKNSVVQEVETPTGRAITIQSQQIYLHTWDGENGGPQISVPHAASHTEKADNKESETTAKEESGPGKPGFLQLSPKENSGSEGHAGPQASTGKHHHRTTSITPIEPSNSLDLTRLLDQGSLLSSPIAPAPQTSNSEPLSRTHHHHESVSESQPKKEKGQKKGKASKQHQLEDAKAKATTESEVYSDESEAAPLEADAKQQAAAIQASINGLLRIFFSLVLVLGLIMGFVKVLLPKLLDRYPDFFEKLKEGKQWSTEIPSGMMNNRKPPAPKPEAKLSWLNPKAKTEAKPAPAESSAQHGTQSAAPKATALSQEPSKKSYLERLKVAGDYFQVLQSTMLGKGKELHLVELKGKQFLVATTPYTVTLLKDLSEEPGHTPHQPAQSAADEHYPQPEAKRITQKQHVFPEQPPHQAKTQAEVRSNEPHLAQTETIAYLSDETPIRRVSSPKPHATPPGGNPQARRKPAVPQFPAPPDEVYQSYLSRPPAVPNGASRPQPAMAEERSTTQQAHQPAYIDAEEVVVLEDYDDIYGR